MAKETYNQNAFLGNDEIANMKIEQFKQLEYIRGTRALTKGEKKQYLQLINTKSVQTFLRKENKLEKAVENYKELVTL